MPTASSTDNALVCRLPPESRLLLIGLGGVGGAALPHLAVFLHNLRIPLRLLLVDGDAYQPADARRQIFSALGNKAEIKAAETIAWLGDSDVAIVPVPEYVTGENVGRLIRDGDCVFLCVDNHPTRKLVSDRCGTLDRAALFSGGNDGVDPPRERGTYGNVQIALRRGGQDLTMPLTCLHPEIANPQGSPPGGPNCGQLAVSLPQIGLTNLAVASALLSAFFAYACGRLTYQEVQFDILDARMLPQFPLATPAGPASGIESHVR